MLWVRISGYKNPLIIIVGKIRGVSLIITRGATNKWQGVGREAMTSPPPIKGGVESMTPPIGGGLESTTPHLLVAPLVIINDTPLKMIG